MSVRTWIFVVVAAVAWYLAITIGAFSQQYTDKDAKAACEMRAYEAKRFFGGLNGDQNTGPINLDEQCDYVRQQMKRHNEALLDSAGTTATLGSVAFLLIAVVVHISKRRHRQLVHEIQKQTKTEIIMGDVFRDIKDSTIINRSSLTRSLNSIESNQPEMLNAIGQLAKIVAASHDRNAGELYEQIAEEVSKPTPRHSVLKSCWDALLALVPVIKDSADVFKTVNDFVQGS
jgi:hypothetical protein